MPSSAVERRQRALPEGLADDRGVLEHAAAPRRSSESSRAASTAWTVSGRASASCDPSSSDAVDHLLGEQRVAAGALGDLRDEVRVAVGGAAVAVGSSALDQLARLVRRQRLERDRRRVAAAAAPARAALEQLVARQADDQDRAANPAGQVLDQVEHSLVGPVDVLDREDQRAAPRLAPRRASGRRRRARSRICCGSSRRAARSFRSRLGGRLDPERPGDASPRCARRARSVSSLSTSSSIPCEQLRPGQLGSRRCRRSRTRRGRSRRAPSRRARRRRPGSCPTPDGGGSLAVARAAWHQLAQQARLADAGLADHGDQVRAPLALDAVEERDEQLRTRPRGRSAASAARLPRRRGPDEQPHGLPGGHRLRLALQRQRLELARTRSRRGSAGR